MRDGHLPRMTKRDIESFVRIHAAIAAAHTSLNQSSWSGRAVVINVMEQCDLVISELFNRCERYILGDKAPAAEQDLVNDQSALTAQVELNGNLDLNAADKERV